MFCIILYIRKIIWTPENNSTFKLIIQILLAIYRLKVFNEMKKRKENNSNLLMTQRQIPWQHVDQVVYGPWGYFIRVKNERDSGIYQNMDSFPKKMHSIKFPEGPFLLTCQNSIRYKFRI